MRRAPFHYIKSSNLVFCSVGLGFLSYLFFGDVAGSASNVMSNLFFLGSLTLLGLLIRLGYRWVKNFFLVLLILGAAAASLFSSEFLRRPLELVLTGLVQGALLIWALFSLFFKKQTYRGLMHEQLWQ